jgi:RNA polymerase sigma-70 factor (ECF subfamily)
MATLLRDELFAQMTAEPRDDGSVEREAITRAQRGELGAFEELYRRQAGRVFALCLRMSGDPVRARELTQDVFIRAWERLESYRGDAAFATWMHRLAVNVVLTAARTDKRRTSRVALGEDLANDGAAKVGEGFARPDSVESRIDLERAIAQLPPGARNVFVLHDIEGYKHEEIARMTGSAEGTLRAQLFRARKLLMEMLDR